MKANRKNALITGCILTFAFFFMFVNCSLSAKADTVFHSDDTADGNGHLIVSMVYDDSGSMEGAKNSYCNYTFQLFLSLFGEKDELYITYMSKSRTSSNYSINNNRQGRIDNLRLHNSKIFTPITAVKTAYQRLQNEEADSRDTYWLIVLTDGIFYNDEKQKISQEELDSIFEGYTKTPMNNGSSINILYVGIGDEVNFPQVQADNLHMIHTKAPEDILKVLDYCGEIFTECSEINKIDSIEYHLEDNVLEIDSILPLQKVILIQYNIEQEVKTSAKDLNKDVVPNSENLAIYHSYMDYEVGEKKTIRGQVSYYEKEEGFIQDGVVFEFDEDIDPKDISIYVQPALRLDIDYFNQLDEPVLLPDCGLEDILKARLGLRRLDNDEIVDLDLISKDVEPNIAVTDGRGRMLLGEDDKLILKDISMVDEGMDVSGSLSISGSYTYRKTDSIALYKTVFTSPNGFEFQRTALHGGEDGLIEQVTRNDAPFDRKDMASMIIGVEPQQKIAFLRYNYHVCIDGTLKVIPEFGYNSIFGKVLVNWLCVWLVPARELNVDVTLRGLDGTLILKDTVPVMMNTGGIFLEIWYHIYPFLVVILIVGYVVKRRFKKGQRIYYTLLVEKKGKLVAAKGRWSHISLNRVRVGRLRLRVNSFSIVPYMANRKSFNDIIILASAPFYRKEENSVVFVLKNVKYTKIGGMDSGALGKLEIDGKTIAEHLQDCDGKTRIKLYSGEYLFVQDENQRYIYHMGKVRN